MVDLPLSYMDMYKRRAKDKNNTISLFLNKDIHEFFDFVQNFTEDL